MIPGHCHDIDGDLWHEPGTCTDPACRRTPCCCTLPAPTDPKENGDG